jgi:FAD synthetase
MDTKANEEVLAIHRPKVLVFGTFDGIHKGHLHFLNEAAKLGDLYVSVASDVATGLIKGHLPLHSEKEREQAVEALNIAHQVVIGETKIESWKILKILHPNIIALGYDQEALHESLLPLAEEYKFEIKIIDSFEPQTYHSKFLNS